MTVVSGAIASVVAVQFATSARDTAPVHRNTLQSGCACYLKRPSIDWEKVAQCLDDRTARELGQVLAGATVEEMGEANYKHFRRALPKVRCIAWQLQQNY
jgi:hypothetical protein